MQGRAVQGSIFRKPEILNRQRHAALRYDARRHGSRFAADILSVPLAVREITTAATSFPVFFIRAGGALSSLALLGLRTAENLFVTADGRWDAPYVPAFIRRYPFAITRDGAHNGLCIDAASDEFSSHTGEPLFMASGANAPLLDQVMHFLQELELAMQESRHFHERIAALDLLDEVTVQVASPHGAGASEACSVTGLLAINEQRLAALPANAGGLDASDLRLVQAHLQSLQLTDSLAARLSARQNKNLIQEVPA